MKRVILFFSLIIFMLPALAQQLFTEGVDYQKLANPQAVKGDQVEVIEFFSYACPHCYNFEPYIKPWKKNRKPADVVFKSIPVVFNASWVPLAKAYYAGEALNVLDKTHNAIFEAIHVKRKQVTKDQDIADIVDAQGVSPQKFLEAMGSFAVQAQAKRAMKMPKDYQITGVPAVIVNGKYMVTGSMSGGYDRMLNIMDHLIAQESQAQKPTSKSSSAVTTK